MSSLARRIQKRIFKARNIQPVELRTEDGTVLTRTVRLPGTTQTFEVARTAWPLLPGDNYRVTA